MKGHRHWQVLVLLLAVAVLAGGHLVAAYHAWNVRWTIFAAVGIVVVLLKIGVTGWLHAGRSKRGSQDDDAAP
jgi:hypothetical protein